MLLLKVSVFSNASDKLYRLDALYRGIKKNESHSTKPRQPITFGLLRDICHRYTTEAPDENK
jgi:hypothetical protein